MLRGRAPAVGAAVLVLALAGCSATAASPSGATSSGAASAAPTAAGPPVSSAPSPSRHSGMGGGADASGVATASSPAPTPYERLRDAELAVLAAKGPAAALAALDRAIAADPSVSGVCHAVAHDIGHATLARDGGDAARALSVRNDVCGGGYTHGVVEQALAHSTDVARDLLRICAPANDGSCFHGVGHGVMFAEHYDVAKALRLCDRAPSTSLAGRCGEGVFMQLFTLDDGAMHVAAAGYEPPTPDSAATTCDRVRSPYDAECWFYSPTVWLQLHPEDWPGVVAWCRRAAAGGGLTDCVKGVGSRLVKYHPDDPGLGGAVCARLPAGIRAACLRGMGSYWSVHWKGARSRADVCRLVGDRTLAAECRRANA